MKLSAKTDMSISWLRVLRLLDAGDKVKRETAEAVAAVQADRDRSEDYKARTIKQLRKDEGEEFARIGNAVYNLMSAIDDQEQALSASVNYNNPALVQALQLVKLLGKGLPFEIQSKMVADFVGDPCGLRCLKAALKAESLSTAAVDAALVPFTTVGNQAAEAAGELLAYATTNDATREWRSAGVRAAASRAQSGYNLDFDNPIVAELEHIQSTTADKGKAAAIRVFLKNHGRYVTEDAGAGGPTELAVEKLADWRAGEDV